jgi:ribosomal protein L11 methylase PrmA
MWEEDDWYDTDAVRFGPTTVAESLEIRPLPLADDASFGCLDQPEVALLEHPHAFLTTAAGKVHCTTLLVLELLIAHRAELSTSSALLDYGCGSGVLSLAAIALHRDAAGSSGSAGGADPLPPVVAGPLRTYGVEVNEAALGAARRNALLNGCERYASFGYAWELPSLSGDRGLVDVAVANMMPGPLLSVIPELIARTREDGLLLISGFRAADVPALRRALEPHFAVPAEPAITRVGRADEAGGEWLAFVCRRRVGPGFDLAELSASAV